MTIYKIKLHSPSGDFIVSSIDCEKDDSSRQLSLYLFRNYQVQFFDDKLDETGDTEKVLKDMRTAIVVWRQGDTTCTLQEGDFSIVEMSTETEKLKWWERFIPTRKEGFTQEDIEKAWQEGCYHGYSRGLDEGKAHGYSVGRSSMDHQLEY